MTFSLTRAETQVPILISMPHVGILIPAAIAARMHADIAAEQIDTDWHVDRLYPFAESLGISLLKPHFSRYVVDLNRPSDKTQLYSDGRQQTSLVPSTDFSGAQIYREQAGLSPAEIEDRRRRYYQPYHLAIAKELAQLRASFDQVLLFEAHSIRRSVPEIHSEPFPDFILGDNLGASCAPALTARVQQAFGREDLNLSLNQPFQGGHITRHYADKASGIHCLQLEVAQDLYLQADRQPDPAKLAVLTPKLTRIFTDMITWLTGSSAHG